LEPESKIPCYCYNEWTRCLTSSFAPAPNLFTIVSYNANAVENYTATSSLMRFESNNFFFFL
jgi:hypothetical protein